MNREAKLTIIVPIYNTEKYLDRCIKSIISQTFTYWKLILVDDGSSDNSLKICWKYKENDKRIDVIYQKNQGQTIARKVGLERTTTDLVVFIDSDDWINDDYLEKMYNEYVKSNGKYDLIMSDLTRWNDYGIINNPTIIGKYNVYKDVLPNYLWDIRKNMCLFSHSLSGKIFVTKIIKEKISLINPQIKIDEDGLLLCHIIMEMKNVIKIGQAGYNYYMNEKSITHNSGMEMCDDLNLVLEEYKGLLSPYISIYEIKEQFGYRNKAILFNIVSNHMGYKLVKHFICPMQFAEKRVIVYGAGYKGIDFVNRNKNLKILHWVDKNYTYKNIEYNVENPENIKIYNKDEYDFILIAIEDRMIQKEVIKMLLDIGVEYEKIWPLEIQIFIEPIDKK